LVRYVVLQMVRAMVFGFLPVAVSESVLMQSQANSDGSLALETAHEHMIDAMHSGRSRVQKNARDHHENGRSYKSLLDRIVQSHSSTDPNTGKPWVVDANDYEQILTMLTELTDELKAEKTANEVLLSEALDEVKACNTERGNKFTAEVLPKQAAMQGARIAHATCRGEEDNAIASMESQCSTFQNLGTKCHANQDWYSQQSDSSIVVTDPDPPQNTLQQVIDAAGQCKGGIDGTTAKANECDTKQRAFKNDFCTFETSLTRTCDHHNSCYTTQTGNLAALTADIKTLEVEQKTIFRAVGKVECYVNVIKAYAETGHTPVKGDIDNCISLVVADDVLDIIYPNPQAKDKCVDHVDLGGDSASPTYKPGAGDWYVQETTVKSGNLTQHGKLNADSHC